MLVFQGPPDPVQCLAFVPAPDGGWLVAGHRGTIVLWPLPGGDRVEFPLAPAEQVQGTHGLEELAVSPDGQWIAARWHFGVRSWRRKHRTWADAGGVATRAVAIDFRGRNLDVLLGASGAGGWSYTIQQYRPNATYGNLVKSSSPKFSHPANMPTNCGRAGQSPDGRLLATAACEKAVHLFDRRTGRHLGTLPQRGVVEAIAWSADGTTMGLYAGTTVRLYDVKSQSERRSWPVKFSYRPQLAFSPDGRLVATTDTSTGVHLWDATTGARRTTLRAGRERRVPVAFAPDGLTIAAGGANGSVAMWDIDD